MNYRKYEITKDYNNIYYFLKDNSFSENFIKNLRKELGNIKVNNTPVNIKYPLHKGDLLEINNSPNKKTSIMPCILPLNIVYEDKYYLLVYKDSGISCMPNRSHYANNLSGAICNYMSKKDKNFTLRIINRLDKDTAGIILVAKDSIAQKDLKIIHKTYEAICIGEINTSMIIDKKIKTITNNGINNIKRLISDDGQEAKTYINPINYSKDFSYISLQLEHGRTHQIRVHLSHINHPLLGDEIYGEKSNLINHTALICNNISFYHPYINKTLTFYYPHPKEFKTLIHKLFNAE